MNYDFHVYHYAIFMSENAYEPSVRKQWWWLFEQMLIRDIHPPWLPKPRPDA